MTKRIYSKLVVYIVILLLVFSLLPSVTVAMGQVDELSIEQFALTDKHVLVLASNGKVYAWGENYTGQLGSTAANQIPYPIIVPNLNQIVKVAAASGSYANSAAIDTEGHVWTWGSNSRSQLGRNVISGQNHMPGKVLKNDGSLLSDITDIALGEQHMIALDSHGQVWGWGNHFNGQVGHGGEMGSESKSKVNRAHQVIKEDDSPLNNIVKINVGRSHSLALDEDGGVWVWGNNTLDSLGTGNTDIHLNKAHRLDPAQFNGKRVLDVATGGGHTLALVEGENDQKLLYGWGANNVRQLGVGSFTETTPIMIEQPDNPSFPENIVGIGAGSDVSVLFAEVSGEIKVYTAGSVSHKKLGHSEETGLSQINFYEVQGVSNPDDMQFSDYNGFLLQDGHLQGWGRNHVGQMGQGMIEDVSIGIADAVTISNHFHTELSHLSLSVGQLFPAFHPDVQDYIVHLGSEFADIEVLDMTFEFPALNEAEASYSGTNTVLSSEQTLSLPMANILQGMTLTTTAPNELTERKYQFHFERNPTSLTLQGNLEDDVFKVYPHAKQNIDDIVGKQAHDGGFILGYTVAIDPPFWTFDSEFVHLVKTSATGEPEWSRMIGEQDKQYQMTSIELTDDGGYIIAGDVFHIHAYEWQFYVMKINATGELEWKNEYNPYQYDGFESHLGRIIPLTSGQYATFGVVNQYFDDNWEEYGAQIVLIYLDSNGQEQSRRYYTFLDDETDDFVFGDIVVLPDGGFDMIAKYEDWWWGHETLLYMRLDTEGNIVWMNSHPFEEAFELAAAGIVYGDHDEGAIIGRTDEYSFVLPFAADGSFSEDMITDPDLLIHRSIPMPTGDVLVAGAPLIYGDPDGFVITTLNVNDWTLSEEKVPFDISTASLYGRMSMQWLSAGTFSLIGLTDDDMGRTSPFLLISRIEMEEDQQDPTHPPAQEQLNNVSAVSSIDGQSIQVVFDAMMDGDVTIDLTKFEWIGFEIEVFDATYDYDDALRHTIWLTLTEPIPAYVEAVVLQMGPGALHSTPDDIVNTLHSINVLTPYERHMIKQELIGHEMGRFTIEHVVKGLDRRLDVNRDGIFDQYDVWILLESVDSVTPLQGI